MIDWRKSIKVQCKYGFTTNAFAKHNKVGAQAYDIYGKLWEIGEDINFDKFWFREVKK